MNRNFTGLKFVNTSQKKDKKSGIKSRPDISVYQAVVVDGSLHWVLLELFIEWKDGALDGFHTTSRKGRILDKTSAVASEIRGQIFSYAAQIMDHQHRLFVFGISIHGTYARFYRFDPSCVVVSEPTAFMDNPTLLVEFFRRYSALSTDQRGYDTTVTPANNAEKKLFKARLEEYNERVEKENLRKHPGVDTLGDNIVKIQVDDDVTKEPHWYLACKPSSSSTNYSPCGKITRGFIATPVPSNIGTGRNAHKVKQPDSEKGKLCWLKDCWRSDSVESEANIYRRLKNAKVPNLPKIKYAGDILVGSMYSN